METENEIKKLALEFKKIRNCGGKIIFPLSLKQRVISLLMEGHSVSFLSEKLDLYVPQILAWKSDLKDKKFTSKNQSFEIKTIPIVLEPETNKNTMVKKKKERPKIFFRFFSFQFSWR